MSSTVSVGYSTLEAQEAFLALPKEDQELVLVHHHSLAKALNGPKTIEIAGKTILLLPFGFGAPPERFREEGGLVNPKPKVATADKNQDKMMYWEESFEDMQATLDGTLYKGFDLWKQVYKAFPEYKDMTEEQARKAGLYPTIHYYNHAGRKWMAVNHGGHLAALDNEYQGELRNIWDATEGKGTTNLERLATIGQAPLGWRDAGDAGVYDLGDWVVLASGSLGSDGLVRSLYVHRDSDVCKYCYWQRTAISSVVVLDK